MSKKKLSIADFGKMMHEIIRVYKKKADIQNYEGIKISPEQFGLLHAISIQSEEVIQKDLAETMGKDKSAILRLIDSLEEKGVVRRVADLKDRRKNYLMITKLGNKVLEHNMKIFDDIMMELQQDLTIEEIELFDKVVHHIKSNAEKMNSLI